MIVAFQKALINRIIIIELDETKAAFTTIGLVRHLLNVGDGAKLSKIISQVVIGDAVFEAAQKELLYSLTRSRSIVVSGSSSLGFYFRPINCVWTVVLTLIYHFNGSIRYKAEASGSLCISEFHHDAIHQFSIF